MAVASSVDPRAAGKGRRALELRPVLVALGVTAVAAALVIGLRVWLSEVGPFPGDEWAIRHIWDRSIPGPFVELGTFFSVLGSPIIAVLTVCTALPIVARWDGWRAVLFVLLAGCGVFFNMALKVLSGPTPLAHEHYELNARYGAQLGNNFPSGHTVYGVVVFGALAWLAWRHRRLDVALPLTVLVVLMGPFRVIAEAHYVSDVIAAYLVGVAWVTCAAVATGVWRSRAA